MIARAAWAWPVLLLALSLCRSAVGQSVAPADVNTTAQSAIAECARNAGDRTSGLGELESRCPELFAALQSARIRPLIIESSQERFDQRSLRQLQGLLHPARGPAPAVGALAPILHTVQRDATVSRSWLRRLWDWVVDHLIPKRQQNASYPWVGELLQALGRAHWLWMTIIWGTVIALPIVVIVVVVREVRAMGRRSTDAAASPGMDAVTGPVDSRLAQLRRVPLGQRPAQLFAMLIARMVAAGRLPPDRSMTHREVVRRALLDDPEQQKFIRSLAQLSERQLYSGRELSAEGIEELLARGEDLYTTGWSRPAGS